MAKGRSMKLGPGRALAVTALVATTLALAACGGSSGSGDVEVASLDGASGSSTAESTTTTASDGNPQDVMLEFAQCMRDNGVDVPDPTFDENGRPEFDAGGGGQANPDDPEFQAAMEECQSILQSVQQQFTPEDQEAFQDAALEFAQCMRENGVDVPDPDFSGGPAGGGAPGEGGPFGGDVDPNDPDFQAANEKCQSVFADLGGPLGQGN
jgi:hypothetical protein